MLEPQPVGVMREIKRAAAAASVLLLAGCGQSPAQPSGPVDHGRYVGIGTYAPGDLWSKMALAAPVPSKASAATPADDEHVIVVVDSHSGEVRECGDYSGVCVSMNPWTQAVATEQRSPVTLKAHLAEVQREDRATPGPAQ